MKFLLLVLLLLGGCANTPKAVIFQELEPIPIEEVSPVPAVLTENPQPLSDEHEEFVADWIIRLKIQHWDIEILYGDILEYSDFGLLGITFWKFEFSTRSARIRILNPNCSRWEIASTTIEEVFIHELLHLRICELGYISYFYPNLSPSYDEEITYDIARLLWEAEYAGE